MNTYLLSLFVFLSSICSCNNKHNDNAEKTVKDFYVAYIKQASSNEISISKENAIKERYCTQAFLDSINNEELEADPFLHVQDFDEEWLKSLTITKQDSFYSVCMHLTYENRKNCLKVYVVKQDDRWLINDVR